MRRFIMSLILISMLASLGGCFIFVRDRDDRGRHEGWDRGGEHHRDGQYDRGGHGH